MSRTNLSARALSFILSIVMVVSMTPIAWAAEDNGGTTQDRQLLEELKVSYAQAANDAALAQSEADAAQAQYSSAQAELNRLVNDPVVIAAKARLVETSAALDEATQTNDAAQSALAIAQENYSNTAAALAAAQETLAQAQARKDAADASVPATQQALADAQAAFADAESSRDAAQQAYDAAVEQAAIQTAKGSFGFFESVGATDALSALTDSTYSSYTVQGDPRDATSLDNMRDTIQWMRECNRLRVSRGQSELKVTDTLMAMAQADANYSDTQVAHAQQFNVGENLAWNYGSNPFIQWYDQEKVLFDNYVASGDYPDLKQYEFNAYRASIAYPGIYSEIGHYLNVIDSTYSITGFAICTRGSMNRWNTYGQVFSSGSGMSIDEYEARFMAYYNPVCGDSVAKAEAEALAEAQEALTAKQAALSQAQQAAADALDEQAAADAALLQAQADYDALAAESETLRSALDAATAEAESAAAALESAQTAYDEAAARFAEVDNTQQVEAAEQVLASATQRKQAADAALSVCRANEAAAYEALMSATDISRAVLEGIEQGKPYDGTSQTQDGLVVKQTVSNGSATETYALRLGEDYTVSYVDNIEPGFATATITGIGDFHGEQSFGFSIVKVPVRTDGTPYRIVSASDSDFILDVAEVNPSAGANVSIWTSNGGSNQLFTFELTADGYVVLRNVANDGLVLDAAGATPKIGANVSTWTFNEGMNQKWSIVPSEEHSGLYSIASASNPDFVLDAAGAEPTIGANVSIWTSNGGMNQLWTFVPANDLAYADVAVSGMERNVTGLALSPDIAVTLNGEELVEGEDYVVKFNGSLVVPRQSGSYEVTIEGRGSCTGAVDLGEFRIYRSPVAMGATVPFHVVSGFSDDFVLDVAEVHPTIGANVSIWVDNGGDNQFFTFELGEDGYYVLRNVANTLLVLDAAGAEPKVGANVSTWSYNEGMNQKWVLIPSDDRPGYYRIASASNTTFVLDAAGAEPKIGANVSIWIDNGGPNQLWKLVHPGGPATS